MQKIIIAVVAIVVLGVAGFYALNSYIYNEKQAETAADYKDAEYIIGGERVLLTDGVAETETAPDSASKTVTRYFGNEVEADLNGDGITDVAFLLTQETGGSGTFFYLAGAIQSEDGTYQGTSAVFIGDRIAPQTTEFRDGLIIVNYADRPAGASMTDEPSVGKSLHLKYDQQAMDFGEVVQNFEGEADPSRMTLGMKTWKWIQTELNDGTTITPKKPDVFSVTFNQDGSFSVTTDCNGMGGNYTADGERISMIDMVQTLMYCDGSQESEFAEMLTNTSSYHFTSRGEMVLNLKFDSGSVIFR